MYLKRNCRKKNGETYESWSLVESSVEVKVCAAPDGSRETSVLCRSSLRTEKENAMRSRQVEKLGKALEKMRESAKAAKRALRDRDRALIRVGQLLVTFPSAARLFDIEIPEYPIPIKRARSGSRSGCNARPNSTSGPRRPTAPTFCART